MIINSGLFVIVKISFAFEVESGLWFFDLSVGICIGGVIPGEPFSVIDNGSACYELMVYEQSMHEVIKVVVRTR